MAISTISVKGQITLPAEMRRRLKIRPKDRVTIEIAGDGIVIKRAADFFELDGFLGKALPREVEKSSMERKASHHSRGDE